jgi:hypothetical protein
MGSVVHAEKTNNTEATRKMSLLHDRKWWIMFASCFIWLLPELIVFIDGYICRLNVRMHRHRIKQQF